MKKTLYTLICAAMILSTAATAPASAVSANTSSVSAGQSQVETPQITGIVNTDEGVKLSWNKVEGAYKYRVYYKGRNGWTRFAETTGTSAVDTVVTSGSTYTYTVRCVDENGNFISGYNANGWKHKFVCVTPQFAKIENTDKGVKLSWNKIAGAYKYRVYYKGRNGWTRFAETTGTSAVDTVVTSGSTYTYTIRCVDKNGNFVSGYNSNGRKHKFVCVTPQFSKIENTDKGVKLSWNKIAGAYKYRVYYKGRNGWTRFAETTSTTTVDSDVKSGGTYTYTVRCVDKNGNFVSSYNSNGWKQKYINPNESWHEAVYKTVEHPAEIEKKWVVDRAAYTINKPLYIKTLFNICNQCGTAFKDSEALTQHHLANLESCWSWFTTSVWVYYDTGEWLVKNEDEGKRELVLSDDISSFSGEHYMEALGRRSAKRAKYEAAGLVSHMSFEDNYSYGHLYRTRCRECGEILVEDKFLVDSDEELYERNKAIAEEHNKQHKAKGENEGAWAGDCDVLL